MSVVATSFKSLVVSGFLTTRRVANGAIAIFFGIIFDYAPIARKVIGRIR